MNTGNRKDGLATLLGGLVDGKGNTPGVEALGPRSKSLLTSEEARVAHKLLAQGAQIVGYKVASKPGERYSITIQLHGHTKHEIKSDLLLCTFCETGDRESRLKAVLEHHM